MLSWFKLMLYLLLFPNNSPSKQYRGNKWPESSLFGNLLFYSLAPLFVIQWMITKLDHLSTLTMKSVMPARLFLQMRISIVCLVISLTRSTSAKILSISSQNWYLFINFSTFMKRRFLLSQIRLSVNSIENALIKAIFFPMETNN